MSEQNAVATQNAGLQGYNFIENYADIKAIMEENLAGETMFLSSLDKVKVPSAGATNWEVEGLSGTETLSELRGVIVFEQKTRTYWETSYEDSGGGAEPDCSSEDLVLGVGFPGGSCADCPFGQFENNERPACREGRSLYLLTQDAALPVVLRLPPSSLRAYREFKMRLAKAALPLSRVETIVSLEKAKSKKGIPYSKTVFRAGAKATPEQVKMLGEQSKSIEGLLTGRRAPALPAGNSDAAGSGAQKLESDTGI